MILTFMCAAGACSYCEPDKHPCECKCHQVRVGSLCSGYEGLGVAVQSVLGGELAWVADNDPGAAKILAHRFPSVPNLGDITETDWAAVEPVDILTAGFPCQDVSCAGARVGLREGNRSGVWSHVAAAIEALRPPLVVLENVRGLLSAKADSNLEWCPWCLGDSDPELAVRALGAVLGDLADLGFDAEWVCVRASDVGAPHQRDRVFIAAWPAADTRGGELQRGGIAGVLAAAAGAAEETAQQRQRDGNAARGGGEDAADTQRKPVRVLAGGVGGAPGPDQGAGDQRQWLRPDDSDGRAVAEDSDRPAGSERRKSAPGQAPGGRPRADAGRPGGAGIAADRQSVAAGVGSKGLAVGEVQHDGRQREAAERGSRELPANAECERLERRRGNAGPGTGRQAAAAGGLGPARGDSPPADAGREHGDWGPRAEHNRGPAAERQQAVGQTHGHCSPPAAAVVWGSYEPAIRRWEAILGRPAPRPVEPGRTGERLSPRFVEWMMGLPDGWVTAVPGLSRNAQLKALGNGVVPAQAAAALRLLLADVLERAA